MESSPTSSPIADQVKEYFHTVLKRIKFEGIDKASTIIAEVITDLIMLILSLLAFMLFSITIAILIGHLLNSTWIGFACVTAFYVLLVFSAKMLRMSLQNMFIRIFIQRVFRNL